MANSRPYPASLKMLYLHGTRVTDLRPLAHSHRLGVLRLDATRVSNLRPLVGLRRLETLIVDDALIDRQPAVIRSLERKGVFVRSIDE